MKRTDRDEYSVFHSKLTRRVCGSVALSVLTVTALYRLLWKRRMGDVIVWFLVHVLDMSISASTRTSSSAGRCFWSLP